MTAYKTLQNFEAPKKWLEVVQKSMQEHGIMRYVPPFVIGSSTHPHPTERIEALSKAHLGRAFPENRPYLDFATF